MVLATISDLHIRHLGDAGHQCLVAFLTSATVRRASHLALLGDIFDLMAGDHGRYVERWGPIWSLLAECAARGTRVLYAEGNHDMHLGNLFARVKKKWPGLEIELIPENYLLELGAQKIVLGHGDEYNRTDVKYLKYKRFIKAPPLRLIADHVMPLAVLDAIGTRASKRSRAYGMKTFDEARVREQTRIGVRTQTPADVDVVIGGHSHVMDEWRFDEKLYLNNGFPPRSHHFCVVDEDGGRLELLHAQ